MIYPLNTFREFSLLKRGVRGVLLFIVTLSQITGYSQVDTVARLYVFGGNNNDNAEEIKSTSDGGYIVIGSTSSNSWGNTDAYLLKVDSNCNYEWSKALGGTNNDWGYAIEETHDKGFIIAVTSNSFGNGGYDAVLMKRDSLGNYEWKKTYGGNDWDFIYDVTQTYDSGYVFCGETYNNTNGFSDVWVVKTNINGDTLWTKTIGGSLIDKGNAIIETSDSNIVIAGITNTLSDSTQIYVLKFTSTGTLLWDSIYGDTLYENVNAITETINGDYVLTGSSTSFSPAGDKDFYLIRTDKNGAVVWANAFGNPAIPQDDEAFDLFEETNGDLINVGYTQAAGGGMKDAILFKITSIGFWGGLGPTYGSVYNEALKSITVGNNGDYCMAGYTTSFGNGLEDVLIIRLDTLYDLQDTATSIFTDITPLTIKEVYKNFNFNIYPNPAKDFIVVGVKNWDASNSYKFILTDIEGRIIREEQLRAQNSNIALHDIIKGIYFYTITNDSNNIEHGKLIILK